MNTSRRVKTEIDLIRQHIRPRKFKLNLNALSERDHAIVTEAANIMRCYTLKGKTTQIGDRIIIQGLTDDEETMLEAACIIIDRAQSIPIKKESIH